MFMTIYQMRINQRIEELKDKPTMGIKLEEFTYRNLEYIMLIVKEFFGFLDC